MSAWTPPAHGHGRRPVRVRWPRRIAGVLATAALLAVGVAMAKMILPGSGHSRTAAAPTVPAAAGAGGHSHAAKAHHTRALTAAQRRARTAAVATLRSQGYQPAGVKTFDPHHALRVLVGYRSGDPLGPRRAFFFRGSGLVGTDSPSPSSGLKVSGSGNEWATLSYGIYAAGDQACCPSGGRQKVRFGWTGAALAATGGTIPASYQRLASG